MSSDPQPGPASSGWTPPSSTGTTSSSVPLDSASVVAPSLENITEWMRILIEPGGVTELRGIEVRLPGLDMSVTMGGFYDCEHIEQMVRDGLEMSGHAKGVYFAFNPLKPDLLARCCNRTRKAKRGDLATDEHVLRRRWLLIDIDPQRVGGVSATDAEKSSAWRKATEVHAFLQTQGWPQPIMADSGNGYHLLYRIEWLRDSDHLIRGLLHGIADRFDDEAVKVDRSVFNASQITKLYGTMACKGDDIQGRPHRLTAILQIPDEIAPLDPVLASGLLPPDSCSCGGRSEAAALRSESSPDAAQTITRARTYLGSIPPAISGSGGHNRTFEAACRLIQGFALTVEEALPLMLEWNQRCVPPWSEEELRHKLEEANEQPGPRGELLQSRARISAQHNEPEPFPGPQFLITIPEFMMTDRVLLLPNLPVSRPGRKGILGGLPWIIRLAALSQKTSIIVLPDALLSQIVWGASQRPANWRSQLSQRLVRLTSNLWELPAGEDCPPECFLHGSYTKHRHYVGELAPTILGALEAFTVNNIDGVAVYDFRGDDENMNEEQRNEIKNLRRSGQLISAYLPLLLFASSPRCEMSIPQRLLMQGITSELTRLPKRDLSSRPDRALIIQNSQVVDSSGSGLIDCPYLDPRQNYVVFGGNAGRRNMAGRGYRIVGDTYGGWLCRAGYSVEMIESDRNGAIRRFLKDLSSLSANFQLIVATYHSRSREWRCLEDLMGMTRSQGGRSWLNTCVVRIYASERYLTLWRKYFAAELGFSYIPGGEWTIPTSPPTSEVSRIRGAADLRSWLREIGWTQSRLAEELGCSPAHICQQVTGSRPWSPKFEQNVNLLYARLKSHKDTE